MAAAPVVMLRLAKSGNGEGACISVVGTWGDGSFGDEPFPESRGRCSYLFISASLHMNEQLNCNI